jgi:hypothetical protein
MFSLRQIPESSNTDENGVTPPFQAIRESRGLTDEMRQNRAKRVGLPVKTGSNTGEK